MDRYSKITGTENREIVLLKSTPCVWGRCTFCDYIEDNTQDIELIVKTNEEVLGNVTGEFGILDVINSGSTFELPKETLELIRQIVREKGIEKLFLESHWCYHKRFEELREFFKVPIVFRVGIETFDDHFRNKVLKKGAVFSGPEEVAKYCDSVCLMVGIKGQTKEMVKRDMEILLKYFKYGAVNIFIENNTELKRDDELIKWFCEEYRFLDENPDYDILHHNTDFGVG